MDTQSHSRAGWRGDNAVDLHSGGAPFESRPGHRLISLRVFLRFSQSLQVNIGVISLLEYCRLLPNSLQFNIHVSTHHSTPKASQNKHSVETVSVLMIHGDVVWNQGSLYLTGTGDQYGASVTRASTWDSTREFPLSRLSNTGETECCGVWHVYLPLCIKGGYLTFMSSVGSAGNTEASVTNRMKDATFR